MSLIHCPECGKQVSDKAQSCPSCAYPIATTLNQGSLNVGNEQAVRTEESPAQGRSRCFLCKEGLDLLLRKLAQSLPVPWGHDSFTSPYSTKRMST